MSRSIRCECATATAAVALLAFAAAITACARSAPLDERSAPRDERSAPLDEREQTYETFRTQLEAVAERQGEALEATEGGKFEAPVRRLYDDLSRMDEEVRRSLELEYERYQRTLAEDPEAATARWRELVEMVEVQTEDVREVSERIARARFLAASGEWDQALSVAERARDRSTDIADFARAQPSWQTRVTPAFRPDAPEEEVLAVGEVYEFRLDLRRDLLPSKPSIRRVPLRSGFEREVRGQFDQGISTLPVLVRPVLLGGAVTLTDAIPLGEYLTSAGWQPANTWLIPLEIDLARLYGPAARPPPPAAAIRFRITAVEEGCSLVGLSVWSSDARRPLDHVLHPLVVGDQASCGTDLEPEALAAGFLSLLGLTRSTPEVAALHVFEGRLQGRTRSAAVLVPHEKSGPCDHYVWELPESLIEYLDGPLARQRLRKVHTGDPAKDYPRLAKLWRQKLFPLDTAECGGDEALELLAAARRKGEAVFFRLVDGTNKTRYLPLDLLLLGDEEWLLEQTAEPPEEPNRDGSLDWLTTLQPLENELSASTPCLRDWTFVIPDQLEEVGESPLPSAADIDRITGAGQLIRTIEEFEAFMRPRPTRPTDPTGVVLLAHHGGGEIWFEDSLDAWSWQKLPRADSGDEGSGDFKPRFARGSAVILVACSTGELTRPQLLIEALHANGADTVVLSAFEVEADFGIAFAEVFSRLLAQALVSTDDTRPRPTLAELFEAARNQVVAEICERKKLKGKACQVERVAALGGASELIVAGNPSARLCPVREKGVS